MSVTSWQSQSLGFILQQNLPTLMAIIYRTAGDRAKVCIGRKSMGARKYYFLNNITISGESFIPLVVHIMTLYFENPDPTGSNPVGQM